MLTYIEEMMKSKRLQSRRQTPVAADFNSQLLSSEHLRPAVLASRPRRGLNPPFQSLAHGGVCRCRVWRPLPSDEAAETRLRRQPMSGQNPQYIVCNRAPVPTHTCKESDGALGSANSEFPAFCNEYRTPSDNVKIPLTNNFV